MPAARVAGLVQCGDDSGDRIAPLTWIAREVFRRLRHRIADLKISRRMQIRQSVETDLLPPSANRPAPGMS